MVLASKPGLDERFIKIGGEGFVNYEKPGMPTKKDSS